MRKVLAWIGAAALIVLVGSVAGFGYVVMTGNRLDKESRTYADEAVRPVIEHWDAEALKSRASTALLATLKPEQLASMFQWLGTLGSLEAIEPCIGQARLDISTSHGRVLTGQYSCKAQFQNGKATVLLLLIKSHEEWRIDGFHVNSPALIPHNHTSET